MLLPRFGVWMFSVGMMAAGAGAVSGQDFSNKPFSILTSNVGGGSDFAARIIAQGLTDSFGQQVIVDNRGGANGVIAVQTVANASPDGHTLLLWSSGLWTLPLIQKAPYDPMRDFSPVTLAASSPNIIVVHPSLPVKSVKELIALAKARPGDLNYASGNTGSPNHLAAELFKVMAGVNIVRIPYKGTGTAINELIGGQVQMMVPSAALGAPHVKSGKLRALAVGSARSSALFPGMPTVAASGLPGYEAATVVAIFTTARTRAPIISRLNKEIARVLNRREVRERFFGVGSEIIGNSPEQFAAWLKSDIAKWGKLIKDAGIVVE